MKNVILVGMMSSGKTTLGKKLARALNYQFVDLDKLIEKDQGMEISAIFSQQGETYFREVESRILKETSTQKGIVLASGGGTPCFFDNMEVIKKMGVSIFLDVPAEDLARRIENHGKDDRPILSGATSLVDTLQNRITDRLPYYTQADFTLRGEIDVSHLLEVLTPLL
ncbi:shikimate kinase [Dyadobacter sp. BE34]|uniref:Shikimate kinase n=1 Tax=Dyadobacter fermentans TaxID=94254 RepID=A0ABU1QYH8_9BACT|nr:MULTISPECIES: shikimate kinase [Dyadobacter]MDR6806191.1 shikimate kinase [Dyadobacter fermentans]MDR7043932.1 shikimate kinase [Dyadobacter sp. BE242]MDR7198243.1 shikimate kinase [Dyadobacter sp. BE34]MDR7216206.1 shikimate kinase [Dyadobacter sp. BE31]MDR7264268.1 shikimate kinase [Dyadobacter sp. BE32]